MKLASSSLRFTEKLCAAAFPIVTAIGALIFAGFGCFECQKARRRVKSSYCYNDLARLSRESHCIRFHSIFLFMKFNCFSWFWFVKFSHVGKIAVTVSEVVALFETLFIESRESDQCVEFRSCFWCFYDICFVFVLIWVWKLFFWRWLQLL